MLEKKLSTTKQTEFMIEKVRMEKAINSMLHGRVITIYLIVGLIRMIYYEKYCLKDESIFLYERFHDSVKVELDLSNYTTKTDLKEVAGFQSSKLAAKSI